MNSLLQQILANAPTVAQDIATLVALFGNKTPTSPVAGIYKNLQNVINEVTTNLNLLEITAENAYNAVLQANPAIQNNPQTVPLTIWQQLVSAFALVNQINSYQRELAGFNTTVQQWYANNQGSMNPTATPVLPADLTQFTTS